MASWNGLVSNVLESIPYQCNSSPATAPSRHPPVENGKRIQGWYHYNCGNATNHPEVRSCPAALPAPPNWNPPVRTPHTVYVKSLYRIAGQDYCRHHIIRAAVVAGVITEVRAGAGPVVALTRE